MHFVDKLNLNVGNGFGGDLGVRALFSSDKSFEYGMTSFQLIIANHLVLF